MRPMKWRKLGEILVNDQGIPEEVVRVALQEQEGNHSRLGDILSLIHI